MIVVKMVMKFGWWNGLMDHPFFLFTWMSSLRAHWTAVKMLSGNSRFGD